MALILAATLTTSAAAQTRLGVATPSGITVHAPAPPPATARPSMPVAPRFPPVAPPGPWHQGQRGALPHGASSDLFRAGPQTYAPRVNRRAHGRLRPYPFASVLPAIPYFPAYDEPAPAAVELVEVTRLEDDGGAGVLDVLAMPAGTPRASDASSSDDPRAVLPVPVAAPKTLYVIPRCYAGDRLPDAAALKAGCRLADVIVIEPR